LPFDPTVGFDDDFVEGLTVETKVSTPAASTNQALLGWCSSSLV
jgi:hypothetical protein